MKTCKECFHYELCNRIDYELEYHNKSIKEAEEELPIKCRFFKYKADVVEVVRCKECIHYKDEWCEILRAESPISDGFCCYGEKKEGADNG